MKKYIAILVGMLLCLPAWALNLELNDIEISNRAQCAVDSAKPTKSAFLILDGFNAGRLSFGLAKSSAQAANAAQVSIQGMKEFRLGVAGMQKIILQKLANGDLPLLPVNLSDSALKNYAKIAKDCKSEVYCADLAQYLKTLWFASNQQDLQKRSESYRQLDNFTEKSFLKAGEVRNRCYYLKKFSPLQSHLYGTDIRRNGLNSLGKALVENDDFVTECDDPSEALSNENAALQIEVLVNDKNWNSYGHDFWNSLKIYLSWSWRYVEDLKSLAPTFHAPFRSLDLEEGLLFVSNGCKSLTPPKCDSENLSLNSLRELAKIEVQSDEFNKIVTGGPETELIKKGARAVNSDFLSLLDYDKASNWALKFGNEFKDRQVLYKNRLLQAHQFFSVLSSEVTPKELGKALEELALRTKEHPQLKNEFYYLCAEWNLSSNPDFDFLYTDILKVSQIDEMLKQSTSIGRDIGEQVEYFKNVSDELKGLCTKLEEESFFEYEKEQLPSRNGYKSWAQEMLASIYLPEDAAVTEFDVPGEVYLTTGADNVVLCKTSVSCARDVLRHAVNLLNVSKYVEGFLAKGHVQSSEMLNPYNELTACQVYDPFFAKKRVRKRFVGDLINTAVSGLTGIPLYLDVDFVPNKVTSLQSMIENGEVKFDPEIQKGHMVTSILADLGPLVGAPCAVQVSPNADKAFNFYAFGGISVNACHIKSQRQIDYTSAKNAHVNAPTDRTACGGCTLNFVGVTSATSHYQAASTGFNPLKLGVYLFRSIYRFFKGMKDPVNIPRSFNLNLDIVKDTYTHYQGIPSECVDNIKKGKPCNISYCKARASIWLEAEAGKEIKRFSLKNKKSDYVAEYQDECGYEYTLTYTCDEKEKTSKFAQLEKNLKRKKKCAMQTSLAGVNP